MNNRAENTLKIEFPAKSVNEAFARAAVTAFAASRDPNVSVVADVKTAVSEAVTNAVVHAYPESADRDKCPVYIQCSLTRDGVLTVRIRDKGKGIEDVDLAMQPLYTTDGPGERSGMGFTIMQTLCDKVTVRSKPGKGTCVTLKKRLIGP